ncbi:glycosyl hydrolase family 61-domain-containing protein [Mycena epipterygia]|nr:glycosyl hydrolase family 61-domain-containing protein [Mycena epipterygia]
MKSAFATLFSASLIASAAAHGWIGKMTINGKAYKGNEPVEETPVGAPSAIRQIANNLPVKDLTLPELICGRAALAGSVVATAPAGATVQLDWNTLNPGGKWFHDVGPMMTYLASCGTKSCADFDASNAKWFKIDEQGQDASGNWAQAKLDTGAPASVTLPSNLKAGNYLLRHEIIALHTAQSVGGAEFYPNCAQLTVTGSGSGAPAASELVTFPGAYKATHPGILIDVYNMKGAYQFPGPAVAAFVSGAAAPTNTAKGTAASTKAATTKGAATTSTKAASTHAAAATSTKATTTHTSTSASPASTKTCKKTRRARRVLADVEAPLPVLEAAPVFEAAPAAEVRRSRARHLHRVVPRSL